MRRWLSVLLIAITPCQVTVAADWRLTVGAERTEGDYDLPWRTTTDHFPVSLRWRAHPWAIKVTTSHLRNDGEIWDQNGMLVASEESGQGDTSGELRFASDLRRFGGLWLDLSARYKAPTASEARGLGNGEPDLTLKIDVYVLRSDLTPFVTVGRRYVEPDNERGLRDRWIATAGVAGRFSRQWRGGALVDLKEASSARSNDVGELMSYVGWRPLPGFGVMLYAITGFRDGSPDRGVGLQNSFYW